MKRRYIAFTVMLGIVILSKLSLPVLAEMALATDVMNSYRSETTYMLGREGAVAGKFTKEVPTPEAATSQTDTPEAEKITSTEKMTYVNGSAKTEITLTITGREATDDDWAEVKQWLDFAIAASGKASDADDAGALASDLVNVITSAQSKVKAENGETPIFAREFLSLDAVEVWSPYYPELKRGDRGDDVEKLQERLIELGYLEGTADGQFGKITASAIELAQNELLERELALYAPKPDPTPTPAPTPVREPESSPAPDGQTVAEPTPTPAPYDPETKVDGVAGQIFQIRLYSDEFPITVADMAQTDSARIARFQKRLIALGYLTGSADGSFGPNTRRAVMLFNHYNALGDGQTADEATQRAIYSASAKAPEHPILTRGSSGDEVKRLQKLLITQGFMRGSADGDYGPATVTGVEQVQKYLREKEIASLSAQYAPANPASQNAAPRSVNPTTEVTGIADPLFLDEIYSDSIDWIPSAVKNGDSGLDVERLQRRLGNLQYMFTGADGNFGNGTESALRDFQERNGLTRDGVAGQSTLRKIFSDSARIALKPYMLKVSVDKQRVYAYAPDENEEYTILKRTMTCSTGLSSTPTPKGTYQSSTGPGARWHYFKKFSCWAQYAYYIQGDIMFHSVLYGSKGGSVTSSSVRNLGSRASHGCVRLAVEDAKWIYQNCPPNTKIVVY